MPSIILSDNGVSSGSAGIKTSGSNDGTLALQTTTAAGTATTAVSIDTSQNVTFVNAANLPNTFGFKNRIINGGMVIDQRNAGASLSLSSTPTYLVDRWETRLGTSTSSTAQQSSTAPAGFVNSVLLTIGTGASPSASTGTNYFNQKIEGFNCADLGWGTSNAVPVTVSFWVRSSLTGTFGVTVCNDGLTRSYPTSYTISAANTWEQKTITVPGSTSGTFTTNNTGSVRLIFDWGNGSDYKGTANTWANADYRGGATGTQSICATSGATWYVTGVQLEKGSTATSFDFRSYGTELQLCQRYYEKSYEIDVAPATNTYVGRGGAAAVAANSTQLDQSSNISFKVTKRSAPTMQYWRQQGTASVWSISGPGIGLFTSFNVATNTASQTCFEVATQATTGVSGMTQYALYTVYGQWAASAEL